MILKPKTLTMDRWRNIGKGSETLLRSLEHECIRNKALSGSILDVGGGKGFSYLDLFKIQGQVDSININKNVNPTFIADLNQPLPLDGSSYDCVISFNTLEHIREDRALLAKMIRVLKAGGEFVITVPYLYRVHGSPWDFHRHTAEWWEHEIVSLGIPTNQFSIEPLVWSPLCSAFGNFTWFRAGILGGNLKRLVMLVELLRRKISKADHAADSQFALGYYISGRKP